MNVRFVSAFANLTEGLTKLTAISLLQCTCSPFCPLLKKFLKRPRIFHRRQPWPEGCCCNLVCLQILLIIFCKQVDKTFTRQKLNCIKGNPNDRSLSAFFMCKPFER